VEKQAKDVSVAERLALRQTQSVPVLAELLRKLLSTLGRVCCSAREEHRGARGAEEQEEHKVLDREPGMN